MRYWGCSLLILPLLVVAAGCAGAPERPEAAAALDQPLPVYKPQQTNLTPEQKYLADLLAKNGYNGNGAKPTVIVVHKLQPQTHFLSGTHSSEDLFGGLRQRSVQRQVMPG